MPAMTPVDGPQAGTVAPRKQPGPGWIQKLHVEEFGCIKDASDQLTPLHAFIGPNDSGKSTLLLGIEGLAALVSGEGKERLGQPGGPGPLFRENSEVSLAGIFGSQIRASGTRAGLSVTLRRADIEGEQTRPFDLTENYRLDLPDDLPLAGVRLLRLHPGALRKASGLIAYDNPRSFFAGRGEGLPGVIQAILGRGDESFIELRDRVRSLFPTTKRIGVIAVSESTLELEVELLDGTRVRAPQMSEGFLYFLAFAALPCLEGTSILLLEEIENGLHPARIRDVVQLLRRLSEKGVQIILTTHSPLVINELEPEEVTVVTRPSLEEGTRLTPLRETPNFKQRSSVYSLGELWLSYADGNQDGLYPCYPRHPPSPES